MFQKIIDYHKPIITLIILLIFLITVACTGTDQTIITMDEVNDSPLKVMKQ